MSKKRIRARRMITDSSGIDPRQNFMQGWVPSAISANGMPTQSWPHPVYVLPATADAYDQMVEQMAKSLMSSALMEGQFWDDVHELVRIRYRERATEALRAIGITPPKKGRA